MSRLFTDRRLVCLGLFVVLLGLGKNLLADDPPCYGEIDTKACPSLGPTGSCEDQGKEDGGLPDCLIGDLYYNERKAGPYGCKTSPTETYMKCFPATVNGVVQTQQCGQVYHCELDSTGKLCIKGSKYGAAYYADMHAVSPDGCKQKEEGR